MLLFVLFVLVCLAASQEITTTTCGVSKGCLKIPSTCSSSTDCEFLMTYRRKSTDSNIMEFEVSSTSGAGWIALGFNQNSAMAGTRGEICYFSAGGSPVFQGFHATAYATPPFQASAANTAMSGLSLNNGAIICRFSRPVAPSGYQGAVGPSVYPILAAGAVSNGSPVRHTSRRVGTLMDLAAFNAAQTTTQMTSSATTTRAATTAPSTGMTSTQGTTTTSNVGVSTTMATNNATTQQTTTMSSSSMSNNSTQYSNMTMTSSTAVSMTMEMNNSTQQRMSTTSNPVMIDLKGCGKTKGCFKMPSQCTVSNCKFIATWKPDTVKKEVQIEVFSKARAWVALGLNKEAGEMAGTYGEICFKNGSRPVIRSFHASRRSTPAFKAAMNKYLSLQQLATSSGGLICRYKRTFAPADNLAININQELHIVLASGDDMDKGVPGYHGSSRYSSTKKYNIASLINNKSIGMAYSVTSSATVLVFLAMLSLFVQHL